MPVGALLLEDRAPTKNRSKPAGGRDRVAARRYHDWTQFAEVYDTTLDIDLAADGRTWVDDFAVRGPSPRAAPASWRGSPVANGAHYPLYGTLDPAKPGELEEKGFGNVFPNYIVDVVPDGKGGYADAIQFQCLDAGGVRVFEGINFLSRDRDISPERKRAARDAAPVFGRVARVRGPRWPPPGPGRPRSSTIPPGSTRLGGRRV